MLPNVACCSLSTFFKQCTLPSRLLRYSPPGRPSLLPMATFQPELQGTGCHQCADETGRAAEAGGGHPLWAGHRCPRAQAWRRTASGNREPCLCRVSAIRTTARRNAQPSGIARTSRAATARARARDTQAGGPKWCRHLSQLHRGRQPPLGGTEDRLLLSSPHDPGDVRDPRILPSPRSSTFSPCVTPWHDSS